jgi:hypothetical protein
MTERYTDIFISSTYPLFRRYSRKTAYGGFRRRPPRFLKAAPPAIVSLGTANRPVQAGVFDIDAVDEQAMQRAVASQQVRRLDPQQFPVGLENRSRRHTRVQPCQRAMQPVLQDRVVVSRVTALAAIDPERDLRPRVGLYSRGSPTNRALPLRRPTRRTRRPWLIRPRSRPRARPRFSAATDR